MQTNKGFAFFGRRELIERLRTLHADRKHVLIIGPSGIGKTALLRQLNQSCPMLFCDDTSSLCRLCNCIEVQLCLPPCKRKLVGRKNQLLAFLEQRSEPVTFDQVSSTPPQVARFLVHLVDRIPLWIACRSDRRNELGRLWEHLYKFTRIEIPPLTQLDTAAIIESAVAQGHIQPDARAQVAYIHKLSKGIPRILEELAIELAYRNYKLNSPFGRRLIELDRRIGAVVTRPRRNDACR